MRHVVVMVATSYPRYPGDGIGSFMEPIAKGVAARGHEVHLVAPWHPAITRGKVEDGVYFNFFHYAPVPSLNVFGYASGCGRTPTCGAPLDRGPLAPPGVQGLGVAAKKRATVMYGHWVVPGGVMANTARGSLPLVVSVHGSDVYLAERRATVRRAARRVFRSAARVTACSDDLRARSIALGADASRTETVPYGVDSARFAPSSEARAATRRALGLGDAPVVFTAGRLVRKKGFEHSIDAAGRLGGRHAVAPGGDRGDGDLRDELGERARTSGAGLGRAVSGRAAQDEIARLMAAADVIACRP